jgi:hypothetical protein
MTALTGHGYAEVGCRQDPQCRPVVQLSIQVKTKKKRIIMGYIAKAKEFYQLGETRWKMLQYNFRQVRFGGSFALHNCC